MSEVKRYQIPDTRLPFVNTEVAQVNVKGTPFLVSSIWGGSSGGKLYFWNPDTREQFMRELPDGVPGAYMLKTGPDAKLYLGCGNGDLCRYDGMSDAFETLVAGELGGITWGGVVTDRHVFWNAAKAGVAGAVAAYDWRDEKLVKTFAPADTRDPISHYGHRAVEAPDGKIVWSMQIPEGHIIVIDPSDMSAESLDRSWLTDCTWTNPIFVDAQHLVVFMGTGYATQKAYLLKYPEFEVVRDITPPWTDSGLHSHSVMVGNGLYRLEDTGHIQLTRLDLDTYEWRVALDDWLNQTRGYLAAWNGTDVCAVNVCGETCRYSPETGESDGFDLDASGFLGAHALCAVPDKDLIVGAPFINQRFWTIDMATGDGKDQGRAAPSGGQVNQILWDHVTSRAILDSYVTTSVVAYDPDLPTRWPDNPKVIADAKRYGQMRPMALVHDGSHIWMATSPDYGTLGGALCRIDPVTGEIDVWHQIVKDQKVNALALDVERRRIFFSTDIYADCNSATPTQKTAQIVAFDMDEHRIIAQREVEGAEDLHLQVVDSEGRALLCHYNSILAWDVDENTLKEAGTVPDNFRGIALGPSHMLIGSTYSDIGVMEKRDGKYEYVPRIGESGSYIHVAGGRLYYASGHEIVSRDIGELDG